jgi:thiosulfate/3-mercaptopyruvate sulfurtransferase
MNFAHTNYLVDTAWVAANLDNPNVRIIESDEDPLLYKMGHIPGAVQVDWFTTLQHPVRRDFVIKGEFEAICSNLGIADNTTTVFYGDKSNWFACYALWLFQYYGHQDTRIMDGGRTKWEQEGRPLVKEVPSYAPTQYNASDPDQQIRAYRSDVFLHLESRRPLVDVRSPQEYSGELLHMPDYPQEGAMVGGHIPGAVNIPWSTAVDPSDGTFKNADELEALYKSEGIYPDSDIIAYCRIGERSALTWFVLKYLLGYSKVKNYDGSWTEWGNLVGAPVEK